MRSGQDEHVCVVRFDLSPALAHIVVYFVAMYAALAVFMLIEMSWLFLHPGNVTSSHAPGLVVVDSNLRYWLGLPPGIKKEKTREQEA